MYNKKIFEQLCKEMGLELDENPNYDEYIANIKTAFEENEEEK